MKMSNLIDGPHAWMPPAIFTAIVFLMVESWVS